MEFQSQFGTKPIFPPCTAEHLAAIERHFGASLPDDYRRFLLEWNGVHFWVPWDHRVWFLPLDALDEDAAGHVVRLYGISSPEEELDLREEQVGYAFNQRVPSGIVAIGDDNSWNRLCLSLIPDDFGAMYWWHPGIPWEEDGKNVPTRLHLHPVSKSFTQFWYSLVEKVIAFDE